MRQKRKKRKRKHNPSCYLVAPIQKGFPVTDFDVTEDNNYLLAGNAFGCIVAYSIPKPSKEEHDSDETNVFFCYQLQKYGCAAVRHLWIQSHEELGTKKVYAVIGFNQVCAWPLDDLLKPVNSQKARCRPQKWMIAHGFENTKPTEIFTIRNGPLVAIFARGHQEMHLMNFSRGFSEKMVDIKYRLGWKMKVVCFDGKSFCFLLLDTISGKRELQFKNAQTFEMSSASIYFEKAGTNYSCFQLAQKQLSYCSNNNVVKIYDLEKEEVIYRCKGHKGYILATHFDGKIVTTLGTDRKLKLWEDGKCIQKIKNIPGLFNPGYLYKVWQSKSAIYYSADDGIYVAYK